MQGDASSIGQVVYFDAGTYTVSFRAAQRGNYQPAGDQTLEVRLDGNVIGTFTPSGTSYATLTTSSFSVTAGAYSLTFEGLTSGDSTAFIDQVSVNAVGGARTTSYEYTFFTDSTRIESVTTSLPVVSAAQNGPGTADVSTVVMNQNGRPIWLRDEAGFLTYLRYDEATGALVQMIEDVDTTQTGDFTDLPSGWSTPAGGGLHLTSLLEVDALGRVVKSVRPGGNVSFMVYLDLNHEMRVYTGWDSTSNRPTGPTQVYREDRPGSYVETLTMSAAPDVDVDGRPTGTEAISDIQTLSRSYISAGGQVTHVDDYFFIQGNAADDAGFETPDVGTGSYGAFAYNPTGSPWTYLNGAGVAGNGSGFTSGNPNAPAGTQVAFLQDEDSTISQAVAFAAGTYTISFLAAQRQNTQLAGDQVIAVLVDGAVVATITPTGTSYGLYTTATFDVTAGVHTLAFVGQTVGDSTAFIDQVSITQVSGVTPGNAGFETPNVGTGTFSAFQYNPSSASWTFSTDSGVAGNGSGFTGGNPNAPEGTQVGFLQGDASAISQSVSFTAGTYTLSFFAAQRGNYQPGGAQTIEVRIDGALVGTFTPSGSGYESLTTDALTVTAGAHTVEFLGLTSGDSTAFIDQVTVARDSSVHYATAPDLGTLNVNFYRTEYGHDDRGRIDAVVTPNGTIYRTFFDSLSRVDSTWVGTDDTPLTGDDWAPDNNGGNMVQVSAYEYDHGGVGDSNLTQMMLLPGGSEVPRVTENFFDWRDRALASKSGVEATEDTTTHRPIFYFVLDNLGEAVEVDQYDGDGVTLVDADGDGVPDKPDASLLRAQSTAEYDDQGRVFRSHVFLVDQSTGAVSTDSLTSDFYFDHRGNLIKSAMPGGLVGKVQIDGAGRVVKSFTTDGGDDTGWSDADDVSGDVVLEQTEFQYDDNSNTILTIYKRRFHDETATGELGDATTGPLARVSYAAMYYDLAQRMTDSVAVGTNGGAAYTRPGTVPARSDTVLVNSVTYNEAGWVQTTIDPRGIASRQDYDALGRTVRTIAAFVDGIPSTGDDRTTAYTYDGNDNTLTVTAVLPGGAHQTTGYDYGVATGSGSAINSNDMLAATQYPDTSSGDPSSGEQETYTVNAVGQMLTFTDRNGSTHTYAYDVLGRITSDAVTTLGTGVDGAVRRMDVAYDTAGRAFLFSSYADTAGTTLVNQVLREFNGFGQLITEYQEHGSAVNTSTSPKVQYTYSEMSGGASHSRLTSIIYPNGRVLSYNYASGLDDSISRLSSISDNSGTLEAYAYLGLDTVAERIHPEPGITLTYVKLPSESVGDAGDQYTGLDRFDRVVDQRWLDTTTLADRDRFFYEYDRNSNRAAKLSALNSAFDEFYEYDLLNQLTAFERGDGHEQSWNLDAQGNFSTVTTDSIDQERDHNQQNELTGVGSATLTYDANGNLTTDEQGRTLIWDAWNRLVELKDGSTTLLRNTYDAQGWRVTADDGTEVREFFYSAGWQVLEEQVGGDAQAQYVWSPIYVDAMILRDRDTDNNSTLNERLYVTQDANFNATALIDASGNVVERFTEDPYGKVTFHDASWDVISASGYDWQYTHQGLHFEAAVGLFDNRGRWYSPTLMRFVSNDPAGFVDGTNLFAAYRNSPVNMLDPTGLTPNQTDAIVLSDLIQRVKEIEAEQIEAGADCCLLALETLDELTKRGGMGFTPPIGNPNGSGWNYLYTTKWGWVDIQHFLRAFGKNEIRYPL
ncbi:MAG: hypothetical protein JNM56_24635 [Planctomycetia bacterium]|nr:hypothetical protein [Planctomycetia bacterium]